jgi:hypothetical protein
MDDAMAVQVEEHRAGILEKEEDEEAPPSECELFW